MPNDKIKCELQIGNNIKGSEILDYASRSEDSTVTES